MNTINRICVAVCLLGIAPADAALTYSRISGRDYASVREIMRHYGLGPGSLLAREHRRDIALDGVDHWLSFPVASARGTTWISRFDVQATLDPVLRARQFRGTGPARLVILDPGHGGSDRGTRGRSGQPEKWYTLDLAKRVENRLTAAGVRVALTRTTDRTLDLSARTRWAARQGGNLFVSLHFNAALGAARGIETFCLTPVGVTSTAGGQPGRENQPGHRHNAANLWLAHCVQKNLIRSTGAPDRGVRRARFQVLREAACPAILIEAGFLSNTAEEQKIRTPAYRDLLAKAIADGILHYKRSLD